MTDEKKDGLTELLELLKGAKAIELEDVKLEGGDIELDVDLRQGPTGLSPAIMQALQSMLAVAPYTVQAFQNLQSALFGAPLPTPMVTTEVGAPSLTDTLIPGSFELSPETFKNQIATVQLGATRAEGGTRDSVVTIGGHKTMQFHSLDSPKPVVTFDCFDIPISLPKPIRKQFGDAMQDPGEWAKKAVNDFGAEAVTIHVISTDPYIKDTPPREAAKTVEEVLQAVKVPLVIGASGNVEKDPSVLIACAEAAEGERCLLASANENFSDKSNRQVAEAAIKHGHNVLSFTAIDLNNQKKLNRTLLDAGVPHDHIVQDPTTASLGYGLEYSVSIYERIKLAGLKGDKTLAMPCSSGTTNAWGAREAHRSEKKEPLWGSRDWRGPLWEATTAFTLCLAGADLFMMLHPYSVKIFKQLTNDLLTKLRDQDTRPSYEDWVTREY